MCYIARYDEIYILYKNNMLIAEGAGVREVEGFCPGDQFVADGVEGDFHVVLINANRAPYTPAVCRFHRS